MPYAAIGCPAEVIPILGKFYQFPGMLVGRDVCGVWCNMSVGLEVCALGMEREYVCLCTLQTPFVAEICPNTHICYVGTHKYVKLQYIAWNKGIGEEMDHGKVIGKWLSVHNTH